MGVPASAIATWRDGWAARMVDACTITDVTTRGTWNASTLVYDGGTASTVYTGGCLLRPMTHEDRKEFGLETVTVEHLTLFLPHTVTGVAPGQQVVLSAAEYEPAAIGAVLVVVGVQHDSWNTRRKVAVRYDQGAGYADPG